MEVIWNSHIFHTTKAFLFLVLCLQPIKEQLEGLCGSTLQQT
jgi:hypothetical protein